MKRLLDFLGVILCGLAALIGLLAGGIVLVVYSLFNRAFSPESI